MTPGQAATRAVSHPRPGRVTRCGVALSADARRLVRPGSFASRLHGQLVELVRSGVPVALRLDGLGGRYALHRFHAACAALRDRFANAGVEPQLLEVTLDASALPLLPAWRIRRTLLGNGILNIIFDPMPQDGATPMERGDAFWRDLWQLRSEPLRTVCWPTVRSACTLLSPERGNAVVPRCGLQAPEQSAWVRAELDVATFANAAGQIDRAALTAAVAGVHGVRVTS